jgi:2-isopropylmalate synthase
MALNMYAQGVDPALDFSDLPRVTELYERVTRMQVYDRTPYAGKLVFAAFSGSHQDAIAKGMKWREDHTCRYWTVPYLPIDPQDVGREYETDVIRINSQSGKGGIGYLLEHNFGYVLPPKMREAVGYTVKSASDHSHKELSPAEVLEIFQKEYVNIPSPVALEDYHYVRKPDAMKAILTIKQNGEERDISGEGNGRLDAVANGLRQTGYHFDYKFITYSEHAISADSNSKAAAYVCIEGPDGNKYWGVGTHADIILASVNALVSALNRMNKKIHFVN